MTPPHATVPVLDVQFRVDDADLHFFSVVSTIGTPIDVTTQELRIEQFFPSDDATRAAWPAVRGRHCACVTCGSFA